MIRLKLPRRMIYNSIIYLKTGDYSISVRFRIQVKVA